MSEYIYLKGKTKWFRYQQPNKFDKYSHDLYLDNEGVAKIRDLQTASNGVSGIKNTLKKDDDGYYITLSRPTTRKSTNNTIRTFAPPMVFTADGLPFTGLVGNGSDVTSKVEVYTHRTPGVNAGRAKALRWDSSKIENLIPYERDSNLSYEEAAAAPLVAQKPQQQGW